MVNWMNGRTSRFKAIVSHGGVFDLPVGRAKPKSSGSRSGSSRAPHRNQELYAKFSPSTHAKDFKTPTLVIHGELDFRDVTGQGLQLFTTLQQQKVPSKLLVFPDEGHWVLKPQNSLVWYRTVLDWLGEWTASDRPCCILSGNLFGDAHMTTVTDQQRSQQRQSLTHAGVVIVVGILATTLGQTSVLGRIPIQIS